MGFDLNLEGSCLACISNLDGRYLGKLLLCVASWQCVMTRKTRCCQEGHGTRGLFLGGGESGRRAAPPRPTPHFSHQPAWVKSKMAPRGAVEGQVGRWVPDTLWHVCAKSPIMSGLDSVHFVGEGLTWQVGRDANDHFLHLFFFFFPTLFLHESQRLAGKSCLSIHGCKTRMPGPVFGRVDGLVIDTFLWLNWQRTCKQIDEVKVNTSEIWGSLTKRGIPPLDAITSTVEWQLLNVLKPAEFTPDLLDEFNKCANRLILRFVDLFFFIGMVLFKRVQQNRHRNGSLMGRGIAGWDPPSGLFCIFFPFELQIGGRRKHFGIRAAADFTGQRPKHRQTNRSKAVDLAWQQRLN